MTVADLLDLEGLPPGAKAKIRATFAELETANAAALAKSKDEAERLWSALEQNLIGGATRDAIAKHGGRAGLLMPLLERCVRVDRDTLAINVIRPDGSPEVKISGGEVVPLGLDEFVGKLKSVEDFAPAFAPPTVSPTKAPPAPSARAAFTPERPGVNPFAKATWNLTEQMKIIKADPGRAAALRGGA